MPAAATTATVAATSAVPTTAAARANAGAEITASAVIPATTNVAKRDILFIAIPFADNLRFSHFST